MGALYPSMQRHYRRLIFNNFLPDDGRTSETCSSIIV
jgi:hypothetical protein